MKAVTVLTLAGLAAARPTISIGKREVPQEHSHEKFLTATKALLDLNNPLEIQDTVFALLGNKAAAEGAPNVQNLDCLQQIIADQAFTNAKATNDVDGMATALIFRALERNTGSVGLKSVLCTENAVNPEIAAISQHQDPASEGAAQINADITLALAQQLALIGADPMLALQSGTFAPGEIGDPTGAGNSCDTVPDPVGCIFTQNLLVEDVSAAEIQAAVAQVQGGGATAAASSAGAASNAGASNAVASNNQATASVNVQTFTGNLGGPAPAVISSAAERPFSVNGATFLNIGAAIQRSCAVQQNACANAANSNQIDVDVGQCVAQEQACRAAAATKIKRSASLRRRAAPAKEPRQVGALDFGACSNPSIMFAVGLDGRKEASFAPAEASEFNHGSALNIGIISSFICGQLDSKCKASAATVDACNQGAQAAGGLKGQAAADAFNRALGV